MPANKHKKALKATKECSPSKICKIFSYCITLPPAMNLTESNQLKVCATNPCHFRERLSERESALEKEKQKKKVHPIWSLYKIILKHLKVIEKSVTFSDVSHESWKNMI